MRNVCVRNTNSSTLNMTSTARKSKASSLYIISGRLIGFKMTPNEVLSEKAKKGNIYKGVRKQTKLMPPQFLN